MTTSPPEQTQPPTPTPTPDPYPEAVAAPATASPRGRARTATAGPATSSLPGFTQPPGPPGPDPMDPMVTTAAAAPVNDLDPDALGGPDARSSEGESPSTPGSTSQPRGKRARAEDYLLLTGTVVDLAGVAAYRRLGSEYSTAWLMTPAERDGIAGPLASIVARHAPAVDGDANDLIDGLALTIGVGAYALRSSMDAARARAEAAAVPTYTEGGDG